MPKHIIINSWLAVIYCNLACFYLQLRNKKPQTKIKKINSWHTKQTVVTLLKNSLLL
jgi:uncharacterized protein YutD